MQNDLIEEAGVSILMATYNGERFIDEQLQSIKEQTLQPSELIVVDDISQDRTLEIIKSFAEDAPFPVKVLQNERRKGYKDNFVEGVKHCSCDIVAFCDQDDIWRIDKLSSIVHSFTSPDIMLVHHNAELFYEHQESRLFHEHQMFKKIQCGLAYKPDAFAFGFAISFRRHLNVFEHIRHRSIDPHFVEEALAHDQWIFFLAANLGSIGYIDEPLVRYRQHDSNLFGAMVKSDDRGSVRIQSGLSIAKRLDRKFSIDIKAAEAELVLAKNKRQLVEAIVVTCVARGLPLARVNDSLNKHRRRVEIIERRIKAHLEPNVFARVSNWLSLLVRVRLFDDWGIGVSSFIIGLICMVRLQRLRNEKL